MFLTTLKWETYENIEAKGEIAHNEQFLLFPHNVTKFSKRVENTVEKGEIARYNQFFLFPQCFQKTCPTDT